MKLIHKSSLVWLLVAPAATLAQSAQGRFGTYAFHDEVTGLSIELPAEWERRDPEHIEREMVDVNKRFRRGGAGEGVKKAGVIFAALARPTTVPKIPVRRWCALGRLSRQEGISCRPTSR